MTTPLDRRRLLQAAGAGAAALALPGLAEASVPGFLQPHPRWRFVFVNHATTNPFFVPARFGIEDACSLFRVRAAWTGSKRSDVGEMLTAFRRAIREKADGIAISIIDPHAFDRLTAEAIAKGIPVVSYNADGSTHNPRLAYVGQDLYQSGLKVGARIVELVADGDVYLFIATPGQSNIQPRVDGVKDAIRDSGAPIRVHVVATGAAIAAEQRTIEATYMKHRGLRGMFAVDGGSTQGIAEVMRKHKLRTSGVRAGGYDLLPSTIASILGGHLDFTVDQQPYLQGFLPIQQLFFQRYSGGLVSPAESNTGLKFVTRKNVKRYLTTYTRYEGSSSLEQYPVS